jgi:uncharacterized protein
VRFWDASAIVALVVAAPSTRHLQALAAKDAAMLVWWGSGVECVAALARLERDDILSAEGTTLALQRLREFAEEWREVDPTDTIRETAARFLRVHPLRAAEALQLAAAYLGAERRPTSFVTFDDRLATAARKEGFTIVARFRSPAEPSKASPTGH